MEDPQQLSSMLEVRKLNMRLWGRLVHGHVLCFSQESRSCVPNPVNQTPLQEIN